MAFTGDASEDLPRFAYRLASSRAAELARSGSVIGLDQDDIRQELLSEAWRRRTGFNWRLGCQEGFIARVIRNAAADLLQREAAAVRGGRETQVSLDHTTLDDDGQPRPFGDVLAEEDLLHPRAPKPIEASDLRVDLHRAIARLPVNQQILCKQLAGRTVTEIARENGCSRSAVYDRIGKIRLALEQIGLDAYVRRRPTLRAVHR